ncbi:unnamed protein product [Aphanomyces euteiches]|uniref:Major facilitator superfamily (MFS) profile domain-containing protein n=1 Tax=Aphanomyces euteiches TaxID=100861 RepID=A0A6G0X2W6_9STRA|nr:hypothetical protein Ae201684_009106 [Aphanomyces euteiches]KAH9073842.1 hypothetical protein Ae201684P_003343 [Aphanomyces euteiches]KAH9154203.1 hypothetical protein AeRB84_003668 [Aphanomyces euteiches]
MLGKLWTYARNAEHNVKLAYVFTIIYFSCRSIILEQVLSGYVFVLTQSNEPVGIVNGVLGLVQMIAAIPGGWAVDHSRRDTILKISSFLGVLSAILSIAAFSMGNMMAVYVAFGFWGLFSALQSPALESLFADSIPNGERSFPITIKHMLQNTAYIVGPAICVLFFIIYGDSWNLAGLQTVLIIGTVIGLPSFILLFFFNDDLAYENYTSSKKARTLSFIHEDGLLEYSAVDDAEPDQPATESTELLTDEESTDDATLNTFLCLGPRHVPYLLFASDFIICNGAGMTIGFFPVFFQNEYSLTPSQVNFLFVAQPLLVVILAYLTQRASTVYGTIETVVATRIFSTVCLGAMTYITPLYLEIIMFLLRAGFMRCSEPLRTSLMMDYVPQNLRGRWNSLEGLTQFSYSGSAVVGGYLIERHGYRYCFLITAVIYFIGLMFEVVLIPVIQGHRALGKPKKAVVQLH